VRDPDAAGSLTQDCFLRAYRARERFRGDCAVRTWLMQIAVNLVRDYARNRSLQFWRRARAAAVDVGAASQWVPDPNLSPEARASAREELRAVWEAAGQLPERQRAVFLLRFVEDMDLLEIAAATGMKEGTVKAHLFRALHSIRESIRRPQ
jgi:RNA polymerase sigma-70 factor (ECF subfamily)